MIIGVNLFIFPSFHWRFLHPTSVGGRSNSSALADPSQGAKDALSVGIISFIFMQFPAKFMPNNAVADPGFPPVSTYYRMGWPAYYFAKVLPKTLWKWKNLNREWGVCSYPSPCMSWVVAPPLGLAPPSPRLGNTWIRHCQIVYPQ